MESRAVQPAREKLPNPAVAAASERPMPPTFASQPVAEKAAKAVGYGLPCSNCRAYYPADMTSCPICKTAERVSLNGSRQAMAATQPAPSVEIDDEREQYLKELKSQAFASHTQ